ncbi:MAG TPA: DUF3459 domain-containing protein, partial [Allocoleopsis sp.]
PYYLIAESDLNDARLIRPVERGGYGLDAQWSDDFHHALHSLITGDRQGYYQDYGQCAQLAKAYNKTFIYDGQFAPHRDRFHGMPCLDCPPSQFVVCIQNHDQIGNQMKGDRLWQRISFEALKLAAGSVLLSPYLPLLFMGEEYGETAPFMYFVSHSDPALIKAVRQGRHQEFEAFHYAEDPPDPEGIETYLACKLQWELRQQGKHQKLWELYHDLIHLRQTHPALQTKKRENITATSDEAEQTITLHRWHEDNHLLCFLNFNKIPVSLISPIERSGQKLLDSAEEKWCGSGSKLPEILAVKQELKIQPESFVVYQL